MQRRGFLQLLGAAPLAVWLGDTHAAPAAAGYQRLLVLVELRGGNDGLNTVIPFADANYARLRPRLAIARDLIAQLDAATALHPSLKPLMPLWQGGELAIVQGVGYPQPNLSHFRSIEIWDTASDSNDYLDQGWLTQVFGKFPPPRTYAADGVVIASPELGPLAGGSTRAVALSNPEQFMRQAQGMEAGASRAHNPALAHLLKVEDDIQQAARGLKSNHPFRTEFPRNLFGASLRNAAQVVAAQAPVAVIRVTLNGFDTHSNQLQTHARLLTELAEGLVAFRSALQEIGRWDSTLIMTYSEFGRRPQENGSGGTDHGTAAPHFVLGGKVKGGLYGERPSLMNLDGGNLRHTTDFRSLYATVAEKWWGLPARGLFGGKAAPFDLFKV